MTFFWRSKDYVERAEWTILCAGPSLKYLDPEEFKPKGPVIAVNFAVTASVHSHFLCALDPPSNFSDWVLEAIPKHIIVICPGVYVKSWRALGLATWQFPTGEDEFRAQLIPERCADMDMAVYTMTSMFPAMGMAIHCGARILNIYGADMAGTAGFAGFGKQDWEKTDEDWETRWSVQREQLEHIQSWWEIDPGVDFVYHNQKAITV